MLVALATLFYAHVPTVALADGALGWPPSAPYDRVLATCSVRRIPRPWIEQCRSGAVIVVNVMSTLDQAKLGIKVVAKPEDFGPSK